MATGREPMIVPTMMATSPSWNPRPNTTARVPVNTPDSSMFGVNQTVNIRCTPPYLESAGIGAMPWLSRARSPVWVGRTPSKTFSSSVASAMDATLPWTRQFLDTGYQMSDISDFIRDGQRPDVLTRARSRANSPARDSAFQCAFSPLGLGSTHTRVRPKFWSCGPTLAPGRPNAVR